MAEETKKKNLLQDEDSVTVDYDELSRSEGDNRSITTNNKFKLSAGRSLIALKNHVSTIPMLMVTACLVMVTFSLHAHNNAVYRLQSGIESFYVFAIILCATICTIAYLNVQGKHTSKKKVIWMSVIFYLLVAVQIILEYHIIHEYNVEMNLVNGPLTDEVTVAALKNSAGLFNAHIIMLYIAVALAVAAPIVQPYAKKIQINLK